MGGREGEGRWRERWEREREREGERERMKDGEERKRKRGRGEEEEEEGDGHRDREKEGGKICIGYVLSVGVLHRACLPRHITQHSNGTCTHCYAYWYLSLCTYTL